jgi:hypothetical protein
VLVNVYLFLPGQRVLKLFDQLLLQVFVPILLKIAVCTVETTCPLFFVEVDFVGLVDEVSREQEDAQKLSDLRQETWMTVWSRHRFN